ncbi:hypothetical protein ACO0LM_12515 [Undibacterium sp. Di26W]
MALTVTGFMQLGRVIPAISMMDEMAPQNAALLEPAAAAGSPAPVLTIS